MTILTPNESVIPNSPSIDGDLRCIKISLLRLDGGTQSREELSNATIIDYADLYLEGKTLPPVVVFHDTSVKPSDYWLADGFHRVKAALRAKLTEIDAVIRSGTQRDAVLFAASANSKNGLPRTPADKRRAVMRMLNDTEWGNWTDSRIAEVCAVSPPFVAALRIYSINPSAHSKLRKGINRNGVEHDVKIVSRTPKLRETYRPDYPSEDTGTITKPRLRETVLKRFVDSLRVQEICFKQNVKTDLGIIMFLTDTTIYHVEEVLSPAAFRDAFAIVCLLRSHHDKKLNAVIVGSLTEDAKPWAVEARKCGVQVKHFG